MLRDQAQDPAVRRRIEAVLNGQGSLRDLARDDAFSTMMTPLVERGMARIDAMTPQERERVAADAEALSRGEATSTEARGPTAGTTPRDIRRRPRGPGSSSGSARQAEVQRHRLERQQRAHVGVDPLRAVPMASMAPSSASASRTSATRWTTCRLSSLTSAVPAPVRTTSASR